MRSFVAFLRWTNISGKNKIPMEELKQGFEELDFGEVKTYLNSGSVLFSAEDMPDAARSETMITSRFNLEIPVFVMAQDTLAEILSHAPDWWGTESKDIYDNLIFILPPLTAADVCKELGEPKEGLEQIQSCNNAIFWSFDRKGYQKTNWWSKTASSAVSRKLTIRTANTVRELAQMQSVSYLFAQNK